MRDPEKARDARRRYEAAHPERRGRLAELKHRSRRAAEGAIAGAPLGPEGAAGGAALGALSNPVTIRAPAKGVITVEGGHTVASEPPPAREPAPSLPAPVRKVFSGVRRRAGR